MIRDPFYQDIIQGLNGRLDPELFELCAADLLRNIYPGLVPIRGGSDAGMDGAISDAEGVAFPLVTTTQEDVIGNLTKNLNSYLQNGGIRRRVVLATSQKLTPKRRRNLEERASGLGFTLIQVYSQEALADLLYRSPEWCRELLGLTGQPPALSVIPFTSRPQIVELLIGREDNLDWLRNTDGDLLLVGQPGSGKTFLLYTFAKQNEGLFLINHDPVHIAQSVRAQNPKAIIVDDAHIDTGRLNMLRQLRTQIGAGFRIIATCWPGHKDNVLHYMQVSTSSTHELEPLTRDQIVELIKSAGIAGPVELIRELVNQAEGRPGLAATLCYLCMKGDVRQIALGDALSKDIRTTFEPLLGKEATAVIAGERGLTWDDLRKRFTTGGGFSLDEFNRRSYLEERKGRAVIPTPPSKRLEFIEKEMERGHAIPLIDIVHYLYAVIESGLDIRSDLQRWRRDGLVQVLDLLYKKTGVKAYNQLREHAEAVEAGQRRLL